MYPFYYYQAPDIGGASPSFATVGVASAVAVPQNPRRKKVVLTNDSVNIIYLARGETAYLNRGPRLNANGGALTDEPDIYGRIYTGPWAAIATGAGSNLTFSEDR